MNNYDVIIYETISHLAAEGNAEAQCVLGFMEYDGRNPDEVEEQEKAVELFRKSAEQGWACGQYNYGWCIREGWCKEANVPDPDGGEELIWDMKISDKIAFGWFMKAALQEASIAQTAVGLAYLRGHGVEQDLEQALLWLNRAAEQGELLAQRKLMELYADWEECKDIEKALYWARRAIYRMTDEIEDLCLVMRIPKQPNSDSEE